MSLNTRNAQLCSLKKNYFHGKCFGLTFGYIDDLLSFNNTYFRQPISSIYPND